MNPILAWLETHDGYSFDEGVAVLLRYSANRGVNTFIINRRDRLHLRNELNRLAHIPHLRPLPGKEDVEPDAGSTAKESVKEVKPDPSTPEAGEAGVDEREDDGGVVTYIDLKRHEREDPDKLPPSLRDLWLENRDEYKQFQYCHSQMKLANSDAGRADWRRQLMEHADSIRERWRLFDEEKQRLANEAAEPVEGQSYNPFNDRAYISKQLKKTQWSDELKLNVQRKVEALLSHHVPVKEETLERLRERGIHIP